jgi:XTP/dITP diphosphohydrolase
MKKIKKIIIGTRNKGKYKEICDLLPKSIKKYSPEKLNIPSPKETGKSFEKNSLIKASYFSKKTNLICLSDDSGLEIDILNGKPGIYSSRWSGKKNNFDLAIKRIFQSINRIKSKCKKKKARFVCSLTIYWPDGKIYSSTASVTGQISLKKKGTKGFGYDPIFIPDRHIKTYGEMSPRYKMSIDHRNKAFKKIKKFFI